ncbi:hypothetical protein BH10BAC3_BH10BAC3_26010 [soil metagenome]
MTKLHNNTAAKPWGKYFLPLVNLSTSQLITVLLTTTLLVCCKDKMPDNIETISALKNLQELATVEYTVTKVVKANDDIAWYKAGDRKILITCQASVKAGIDLGALQPGDVEIDGKSIRIKLPEPRILTVNMPPENIKVAYSEIGFFRDDFTSAERDALLAQAEKQVWAAGAALGIKGQAKLNTQTFMNNFLMQLGFEKIELTYDNKKSLINGGNKQ